MKRTLFLMGFLFSTIFYASAGAEEVYVDAKTKMYHKISCRLIRHSKDVKPLEKNKALADGYVPDQECYKEDLSLNGLKNNDAKGGLTPMLK